MHQESQEIQDPAWDCTLIKAMKEHADTTLNAIYEWSNEDVWDFIKDRNIEVNPLYEMGYSRVGCVLCPLASKKEKIRMCEDFPQYKANFIKIFDRMIKQYNYRNEKWMTGEDVFKWWIEADTEQVQGQMSMFQEEGERYDIHRTHT